MFNESRIKELESNVAKHEEALRSHKKFLMSLIAHLGLEYNITKEVYEGYDSDEIVTVYNFKKIKSNKNNK